MSKHFISIVHTPAGTFTSYTQAHVERIHCFIEWIPSPNWFTPTNLYCLVVDFSSPKWYHPVMDFQSPKFCQKQVTIHVFSQQQVFQIFNFSHLRTYDPLKLARHELHIHVIICLHPFDITITWRYRHHRALTTLNVIPDNIVQHDFIATQQISYIAPPTPYMSSVCVHCFDPHNLYISYASNSLSKLTCPFLSSTVGSFPCLHQTNFETQATCTYKIAHLRAQINS